jgi:hypothetical protein
VYTQWTRTNDLEWRKPDGRLASDSVLYQKWYRDKLHGEPYLIDGPTGKETACNVIPELREIEWRIVITNLNPKE